MRDLQHPLIDPDVRFSRIRNPGPCIISQMLYILCYALRADFS
jgi:hypothetical protein